MGIAVRLDRLGIFPLWQEAESGGAAALWAGADAVPVLRVQCHAAGGDRGAAHRDTLLPAAVSGVAAALTAEQMPAARATSIAKIVELQRYPDVRLAQKGDGFLQVVAFLAQHAHLLALYLCLHLELRILDEARDLPAGIGIDAMLQNGQLLGPGEIDLGVFDFETGDVDAAFGQLELEDFQHLFELKVGRRGQGYRPFLKLERRIRAFEVEALSELADCLIDRIREFMGVYFGNDVEGWHSLNDTRAPAK